MRRARMPLAVLVLGGAMAFASAAPAVALRLKPCRGQPGFGCATLPVPLDRTGVVPGTVPLHIAVQTSARARRHPLLIALSGGPGQSAVGAAQSFSFSLEPALRHYRLAVLDQRGTGSSGVLRCPSVQRLRSLDPITADAVAACAATVGAATAFYSTADSVEDIDAVRAALGSEKLALMGVSYGTFVAQQYARIHPDRTAALILDSVVPPDAIDPFLLDTFARLPRILREQCAHGACQGITPDPVADVATLASRLEAGTPLTGHVYDARGRAHTVSYGTPDELFNTIIEGDLNPYLQPALPGAIRAAARGDGAALLRLRRLAEGPATPARDLSFGLNVITGCEDARLPYALTTPIADRPAIADAAVAALPADELAPFDAGTALRTGYVEDCLHFPPLVSTPPSSAPLPDVPALILSGRLDVRTPLENGREVARELPRAQVVPVEGNGHDELDTDVTGCTQVALRRFVDGRKVGRPCAQFSNAVPVFPIPPKSLTDYRSAPGVGGRRGRVVFAVLDTALDAQVAILQAVLAGLPGAPRGGGLHGGSFRGTEAGAIVLHRYALLHGLRLSGRLHTDSVGGLSGRVTVRGPLGTSGVLRLRTDGGIRGRLGGRGVRYRPPQVTALVSASAARRGAPAARRVSGPDLPLRMPARSASRVLRARP